MIFVDLKGTSLSKHEVQILRHPLVSGLTLFARNCESADQVKALVTSVKALRPDLKVAIDQEGGRVQRLHDKLTTLPPMRAFGDLYEKNPTNACALLQETAWLVSCELRALGIDINFSPVLDIDTGVSSVIGNRAFHHDPDAITQLAGAYLRGAELTGILVVAKHFPGHGFVALDSHLDQPVDKRAFSEISSVDMKPYRDLSLPAVMMSHVIYPDVSTLPAGFCRKWLQLLRENCQFTGVVFTDDLTMKAAHCAGTMRQRIAAADMAGCDVSLVCNYEGDLLELLEECATEYPQWITKKFPYLSVGPELGLTELQSMKRYLEARECVQRIHEKEVRGAT